VILGGKSPLHDFSADLHEQQEAHTFRIKRDDNVTGGMAQPVDPSLDTSTVRVVYSPITIDFGYTATNCYSGWWPTDNRSEEEKRQAWREYWQRVVRWPNSTPYSKSSVSASLTGRRFLARIPGASELRKKALSPAMHAHRRFMAKMMKPIRPSI
jgi:hypothetical protein